MSLHQTTHPFSITFICNACTKQLCVLYSRKGATAHKGLTYNIDVENSTLSLGQSSRVVFSTLFFMRTTPILYIMKVKPPCNTIAPWLDNSIFLSIRQCVIVICVVPDSHGILLPCCMAGCNGICGFSPHQTAHGIFAPAPIVQNVPKSLTRPKLRQLWLTQFEVSSPLHKSRREQTPHAGLVHPRMITTCAPCRQDFTGLT